ncbi:MAG: DNA-processing protein DprA [Syntrophales bacterium]|nr:DNA-processing protein DprA [Syntrophales bacterium]
MGIRALLGAFASPAAVFAAPLESLQTVGSIGAATARAIKGFSDWAAVEEEMANIRRLGAVLLTPDDEHFPQPLKNIHDCPALLYIKGELRSDATYLAVVGSRQASAHGRYITEKLCRELALRGITIVSGMARGIDSAAHRGALAVGGRTVAVLGSGLDVIYPPENKDLYQLIAMNGAVVSEFPLGTKPHALHFPLRNRIISGFSLGVVVVEASERSGSLITARLALEQGREVFAVPGAIDAPGSRGTHRLIKEGAKLVENVDDILEEIAPQIPLSQGKPTLQGEMRPRQPALMAMSPEEIALLAHLDNKGRSVDEIIEKSGLPAPRVLHVLLQLELKNMVKRLPGNMYICEE